MSNEQKLNSILDMYAAQVASGLLLKNVKRALESKGVPSEMIKKMVRCIEIRASDWVAA